MRCPHCHTIYSHSLPFTRPIEGGRAYAQVCLTCGRILGIRARLADDPPAAPADLTDAQLARLRFVQWRLTADCAAQSGGPDGDDSGDLPPRAA